VSATSDEIVIAGGGTAGHLYPALAVADALVRRGAPKASIRFVGTRRGVERTLLPQTGYRYVLLPGRGLVRRPSFENVFALGALAVAFARAFGSVGRHRPRVVVAVGGYGGVAYALAARAWRVPVVTVNVDAVVGAANRLIGSFAALSTVPFEGSALPRAVVTGVPVREEIRAVERTDAARERARAALGVEPGRMLVVVVGGSLGARRQNDAAIGLTARYADRGDLMLWHICGAREFARCAGVEPPQGRLAYRLVPFEPEMASVLCAADLLVGRAGAMTVAELRTTGVPSILVPLPAAPGDHQTHNADALAALGGAVILPDASCDAERLGDLIDALLGDPEGLATMAKAARNEGDRDAAGQIAELIEGVASGRRERT
jgi:undecaprenyldiphospho-muramoylpentapeptide beta-N-acetylglucosaminyltransferase